MKIEVSEKGALKIDAQDVAISDLKQDLLEKIVNDSLEGSVEYEIEGESPLANFFTTIKNETAPDSELQNALAAIEEELAELAEETGEEADLDDGNGDEGEDELLPF